VENENSELIIGENNFLNHDKNDINNVSEIMKNYDSFFVREKYSFMERIFLKYVNFVKNLNTSTKFIDKQKKYINISEELEYSIDNVFIHDIQFIKTHYCKSVEFLVSDHTFPKGIPAIIEYKNFNILNEEKFEYVKMISSLGPLATFDINFVAMDPRQIIKDGYKKERGEKLNITNIEQSAGDDYILNPKNLPINTYQFI